MAGKPLIIAEKPSSARAIAAAIGGFRSRDGYLESHDYLLSWAMGHLVELQDPEEYDPRLKRWNMHTLPVLPDAFRLKVVTRTQAQFRTLQRLAASASELINACDAAREGELIFRYIASLFERVLPVRRLWISSLTEEAILAGFSGLRPAAEFDRLFASARCRSQGDWLVGINLTRAYTVRHAELLSVGRVQTPTLALLVRREREVAAFVPETYWEIFGEFEVAVGKSRRKTFVSKWFTESGDRLNSAAAAESIADAVAQRPGRVVAVNEKSVAERPPQPFDLTALQREANRRFGFTAAATLTAAQGLYEAKLITYPRTDSRYLTRDLVHTLPRVLTALATQPAYASLVAKADRALVHAGNRRVVDDSKVGDHHAILPTGESPSGLAGREARVYDLIARRFLAQFYPDARYVDGEVITLVAVAPGGVAPELRAPAGLLPPGMGADAVAFRSRGRQTLDEGWRAVEPERAGAAQGGARRGAAVKGAGEGAQEPAEAAAPLPALAVGDGTLVRHASVQEKQTQAPRRFTEAALLGAMETAGRHFDDEALREAMKGRGLGTPATRAAIIERLKQVGYVEVRGKTLLPTAKGHQLVALAEQLGAEVLLSPELTGEWEKRIADIQAGSYDPAQFMAEIRELTVHLVEQVRRAGTAPPPAGGEATVNAGPVRRRARRGEGGSPPGGSTGPASPAGAGSSPGLCPSCGQPVWRAGRGYTCGSAGCGLTVPAYLCGKVVPPALVTALLQDGRTPLVEGFKSKAGKEFAAYLVLREGKVGFEFPARTRQRRPPRPGSSIGGKAGRTGGKQP